MRLLIWIKTHLVLSILLGMIIGLVAGYFFDTTSLRSSVGILSIAMVYPMMVTLNFKSLVEKGNIKLQLVTQIINFIFLPLLAFIFGIVFFKEQLDFRIGILLIALLPTSGMTVSWTVMAKGNVKEAVRMIVIGLVLGGLLTPLYFSFYLGEAIHLPFTDIIRQIILIVFIPMFLGYLTQVLLIKGFGAATFKAKIKPVFPLFSTLAVVLLITIVMSLRAQMLFNNPTIILVIIGPLVLGYLIMIIGIHFIGSKLFNYEDRVALLNGTMIRNLSLALAIALALFEGTNPRVALIIAVAYVIQVQLAAWYVKFSIKRHLKTF